MQFHDIYNESLSGKQIKEACYQAIDQCEQQCTLKGQSFKQIANREPDAEDVEME